MAKEGLFFFSQRPEEEEEERERKEEEGGRKLFLSLSRTRRSTRNKAAGVRCSSSSQSEESVFVLTKHQVLFLCNAFVFFNTNQSSLSFDRIRFVF